MISKKSLTNPISIAMSNLINIFLSFLSQKIFLMILTEDYLGLNSLFSNIITMLGIFELGIGSAITFSLYKPLANNDRKTIRALMAFYKKAYRIIAILVSIVGFGLTPFINFFIKEVTVNINVFSIYLMFIVDVVCSYLLTYRRSILYADQKNYQINFIHIGYLVIMNILQLTLLAITMNYYVYLSVKIVMRIVENLVIHLIVKKQYSYLNNISNAKLEKNIEADIFKKIKALFFHKIGTFIVLGTDNIIISKIFGLGINGIYSSYYLVADAINKLIGQAITSLTPSVGRKLATKKSEDTYEAFKKTRFAAFFFACIASVGFLCCIEPLIMLWLGKEYTLDLFSVIFITINVFQKTQRSPYNAFKEAAGIYYEDRFIPLVESVLNIASSLIFAHIFCLAGVFMGTIVSGLALWCYSYPKYIYKNLFKRNYFNYFKETVGYIVVFATASISSYLAVNSFSVNSTVMQMTINGILSAIISIFIISICLGWTNSYRFMLSEIKVVFVKARRRIVKR